MPSALPRRFRTDPFLLADATEAGITADELRGPRFRRLFRGVYVDASLPDTLELCVQGARLLLPDGSVLSHHTAAGLYRLPVPFSADIHALAVVGDRRPNIQGIRVHRVPYSRADVARVGTFPVTRPERIWLDLASELSFVDLVTLGDAVLHASWSDVRLLEATIADSANRKGLVAARRALGHLEPRTESPGETWTRLTLTAAGLPRPEANLDLLDENGRFVARPDLVYRDPPVVIEYDGDYHFLDPRQRRRDAARHERVRDLGYEVRHATALDRATPAALVERVLRAREQARGRRPRGYVVDSWPDRVAIARGDAAEWGA